MTPLNLATDAAYAACLAAKTHRAGNELTRGHREWGIHRLRFPLCQRCGVPMPPTKIMFSLRIKDQAWDEAA